MTTEEQQDQTIDDYFTVLEIEGSYEQRLYEPNCGGAIFALKNFGWKG